MTKRKNNQRKKNVSNQLSGQLVEEMCGVSDPFCPHASGSKIPDGSGERTLAFSHRDTITLTPNATHGTAYVAIRPGCGNFVFRAESSTLTGTNWEATTTFNSIVGNMPAFATQVRVVSAGVRVRSASPNDVGKGYWYMSVVPDSADILDNGTHTSGEFVNNAIGSSFSTKDDTGSFIFDCSKSRWFDPTLPLGTPDEDGLMETIDTLAIYCQSGEIGTTSGAIHIEIVIHYEAEVDVFDVSSGFYGVQPSRNKRDGVVPFLNKWYKRAETAGMYFTGDPSFSIKKKAIAFGRKALSGAASFLGPYGKALAIGANMAFPTLTNMSHSSQYAGVPELD